MKFTLNKAAKWIYAHEIHILSTGIALTALMLSAACIWKYGIFAYNGIDLAYFNQVFWNSLEGRFFTQSIHPHLSLGDHAELLILLLLPFYGLAQDPRTLLVIQAAALSAAAAPLYLLAKRRLGERSRLPLILALAYLASPLVHNIALFEFHILPFAIPFLFAALLGYDRGRKGEFLIWATLAMLAREDVALVVAGVGLLAWLEGRSRFWRLAPIIFGAAWFGAAMRLIRHFAPEGGYKFMAYYSWLGSSFGELALNAIKDPLKVLGHVLTLPNLEMLLGFGLPLLFLPYLRPRRLILALGPLAQILLGAPGGGALILETHYASLFLPGLFAAAIEGVGAVPGLARRLPFSKKILAAIFGVGIIYGAAALGPLPAVAARLWSGQDDRRAAAAREAISKIQSSASVTASYALLPQLSSREKLYSLHYVFLGVTQFGGAAYRIPETRITAFDSDDLLTYRAQFLNTAWTKPHYAGGYDRLSADLGPAVFSRDAITIFDTDADSPVPPVPGTKGTDEWQPNSLPVATGFFLDGRVIVDSWPVVGPETLYLNLRWTSAAPPNVEPAMRLIIRGSGDATTRDYGFANAPVSIRRLAEQPFTTTLAVPIEKLPAGSYRVELELAEEKAFMTVSDIRSIERIVTARKSWGRIQAAEFKKDR